MDPKLLSAIGAAGAAGSDPIGVEDVFSTDVWTGTGAAGSIDTGVDMTGGGMVWIKPRASGYHNIIDTERGVTKVLYSNATNAQDTDAAGFLASFDNNGYNLVNAASNSNYFIASGAKHVGWSFKKQKKFFTIKTYSGTGSTQTLTHDLASIPGAIFVKRTDTAADWAVYHRGQNGGTDPEDYRMKLNSSTSQNNDTYWGDTAPTASAFTVGDAHSEVNASGGTYVAYLFGHEEAVFGPNSDQKIISCGVLPAGYFSGKQELGFEPQFLLVKSMTSGQNWEMWDTVRGGLRADTGSQNGLFANLTLADTSGDGNKADSTGFYDVSQVGEHKLYIAIAAETGKTSKVPENGIDVFTMDTGNSSSSIPSMDSGFTVDMSLYKKPASNAHIWLTARLIGEKEFKTNDNDAEGSVSDSQWDSNVGWGENHNSTYQSWLWKRSAGFDCVCYNGQNSVQAVSHNLSVAPEFIWVKRRDSAKNWAVYHKGLNGGTNPEQYSLILNNTGSQDDETNIWNDTAPTASAFTVGDGSSEPGDRVNASGGTYIAMLFASCEGISKCGSYIGQGSNGHTTVTTDVGAHPGFTPRFLIVKSWDTSEGWWVLDTTRGWGAGDDKYFMLNTDDAQVTTVNVGEPLSTGFKVTNQFNMNVLNRKYIYYAHA